MEDMTERVVSRMLSSLEFVQDSTTGNIKVSSDCKTSLNTITQENINSDMTNVLNAAINTEVIAQRKMAKQQYLESQGFSSPQATGQMQGQMQGQMPTQNIQQGTYGATGLAMNNNSGYPIPPTGQDNYGRPYWIDQQTGQMTYEPPQSGLHLAQKAQKLAAWGKWLM